MTKEIKVLPAFDKRDPNPSKNYGIHGAELYFILKGELGAVSFTVYTNWNLPHVEEELAHYRRDPSLDFMFKPSGADISYHSLTPLYEGQSSVDECSLLDGKPCYCDGSGLQAIEICAKMIAGGSEAVWKEMEAVYLYRFKELR